MAYYNLVSIKSQGFMSFDECEFSLSDLGVVLVEGKNRFEPKADSNGSGKSALFEMIIWLLTGSTSRGSAEVANQVINNGVYVQGELYIDENHYIITRSKNHPEYGSGLTIEKNGEDISGDTLTKSKDILNEELNGLDYDTLTSIIILSQGLPGRLSSLKPSSRKSRLEELSNTDEYISDIKFKLDKAINELSTKQSELSSRIMALDNEMNSCNFNITTNQNKINQIVDNAGSIIDKETYEEYLKLVSEMTEELKTKQNERYQLDIRVNQSNSDLSRYKDKIEMSKVEIQKLMNQYNSVHSSVCPFCNSQLTDNSKLESMKSDINMQILSIKQELSGIINSIVPQLEEELSRMKAELSDTTESINSISLELSEYNTHINNYKSYSSSTDILKEAIDQNVSRIESIKSEKFTINEELSVILEQISIANFYKNQVSRKFRSFLLEGVLDYMNHKSKEYSKYLFDKQGVVEVRSEGNNLNIYLGDRRFEDLSGGEGRRVDIILQIIQRDLARNQSGLSSNVLVLDEILDYLDASGVESTINLLEYKSPDVNSLLVVSHKKDVKIPSDTTYTVTKGSDQISRLRFNGCVNYDDEVKNLSE